MSKHRPEQAEFLDEAAKHDVIDVPRPEPSTALATAADRLPAAAGPLDRPPVPCDSSPLADLRDAALAMTPELQAVALRDFKELRDNFRAWLLAQMKPGVHYGFPPGVAPRLETRGGVPGFLLWNSKKKTNVWYPETQWKPRQSLYQSGADFVIELMGLQATFEADEGAWKMAGGRAGQLIYRCDLISRSNGKKIGEGIGARELGQKGGDLNNSVKMACKAAKVAAVINAYGLSDLFTQDLEDLPPPEYDNPEHDDDAPSVAPRGERSAAPPEPEPQPAAVTQEQLGKLVTEWKTQQPGDPGREDFARWALETCGGNWNPNKAKEWDRAKLSKCYAKLGVPE
jgi:hypothetical protein